jgi:general secretion pathway protein L
MARYIGLDIGARYVRVASITTGYRRLGIERLEEFAIGDPENVAAAVTTAASHLMTHVDSVATAIDGDAVFVHRLTLPPTAAKQLAEVLPFEIEAQIPVDIDELVYDYRLLARPSNQAPLTVLVAAARREQVRARIELVRQALGREPERVACGSMALANLVSVTPGLRRPEPVAIVDLGGRRTEITVIQNAEPVMVRTLSYGVEGLPGTAEPLAAEIRQSLLAWSAQGDSDVVCVYLAGGGAFAEGADRFLAHQIGVPIEPLPPIEAEGVTPELVQAMPRFAKAVALALGAAGRGHDVDLRRGALSYQRGFGFLKEKAPLLIGLATSALVSFLFATWAESRALARENVVLVSRLEHVSKDVLGTEAHDAESAVDTLEKLRVGEEADPLPPLDGFDLVVEISKTVPTDVTHDIEEFDLQRGHLKMQGIVGTANEAQNIATELAKRRCLEQTKLGKVTQAINSDRQKYVLDVDVKCPDDKKAKKKPEDDKSAAAEKPAGGQP